jgi:sugar O-acyltransferase (sialic acid O-acetyltransferase NeuD family)
VKTPLYVLGAGGHGKVVAEAARASGAYELRGFVDDDRARWGTEWDGLQVADPASVAPDAAIALGVGENHARAQSARGLAGRRLATVVHPSAVVAGSARLGAGSYVGPLAVVHADAEIGRGCIVNSGAVVEHDCRLGDYVHVSPRATLGGAVTVGEGAHLGMGSVLLPGLSVGAWTTLGAGAVMVQSLPERVTALGVPARLRPSPGHRIHLSPPHLGEDEWELVRDAFASNWIAPLGPHVDAFEAEFARCVGAPHAAALSSGTAALHLALRRVGVRVGDTVFCSTLTFVASANPILYQGATPVFIDSDEASWNMDPELLADELDRAARNGRLPRAVVVVHLYGQSADLYPILAACERYGVPVVEDAAEALGARYHGRSPGTLGRFGIFSFNGNKIITTSGGGMLVAGDGSEASTVRFLASQARTPAAHYEHEVVGFNYRMSNVLAAIGRGQLRHLADRVAARRETFAYYRDALGSVPGVSFMPEAEYGEASRWLSVIQVDPEEFGADADGIRRHLEGADIEARPVWKPMHLQPLFAHCRSVGGGVAERLFRRGLCLPSGSALRDADRARVVETIKATPRTRSRARVSLVRTVREGAVS